MRPKQLLLGVLISSMTLLAQSENYLSLDQAIAIGLQNNTGIRVARGNAAIAERQEGLGTASYLPIIGINASASRSRTEVETNSPFNLGNSEASNYRGNAEATWVFFDGLRMYATDRRFTELSRQAQLQLRAETENQVLAIINAYYNVVRKSELLAIAEEGETISKVRLDQEEVRKNLGGASNTDFLSARVTYNNDRLNVLRARNELQIARRQLNIALGRESQTTVVVDTLIPVNALRFGLDELLSSGLENNALLAVQRAALEVSDSDVDVARANYMPQVAGNASYGLSKSESENDNINPDLREITQDQNDWTVGLNLNWNLYNGGRDQIAIESAQISRRNQEMLLAETERQLRADIRNQATTYGNSLEAWRIAADNIEVSRLNLELFAERYRLGSATFVEYRVALLDYQEAQSNYVEAAYLAVAAENELRRLAGILLSETAE
jgi:outer membrane protein